MLLTARKSLSVLAVLRTLGRFLNIIFNLLFHISIPPLLLWHLLSAPLSYSQVQRFFPSALLDNKCTGFLIWKRTFKSIEEVIEMGWVWESRSGNKAMETNSLS